MYSFTLATASNSSIGGSNYTLPLPDLRIIILGNTLFVSQGVRLIETLFIYLPYTQVYRLVLLNCISGIEDGITSFTDENISIPRIHYAFENSKHLIDLLKQSFSYEGRLAVNLYTTLADLKEKRDEKLKCIELVVLEEITNLCSYKKELTCSKALAEKYVSEIKQWQSVMERGFSFKHSDELSHAYRQRIRYTQL